MVLMLPVALLAAAEETSAKDVPPPAKDVPKKEKKICRLESETGSMFPRRTCLTAKEWAVVNGSREARVDTFRNRPNFPNRVDEN